MSETLINIPAGKFDDENPSASPSQEKEISVPGKELGKINVEGMGQCIFSMLGDISRPGGLDLIMTDADEIPSTAISVTKNPDGSYQIGGGNMATIKEQMSEHEGELSKIVEKYLIELKGFEVTV